MDQHMAITKFVLDTPEADIAHLRRRLGSTRWAREATEKGWHQGTAWAVLKDIVDYWRDGFSWRDQETRLNTFGHFRAPVHGLKIHFLHERGKGPSPVPLLLIHGWPSSFAEMTEIIPRLTDPATYGGDPRDSFDVIVPSLPGYGYSEIPRNSGMSIWGAADLLHRLMTDVLGYRRFIVSGGDWGAYAASYMGYTYPEEVIAIHLSFIPGGLKPGISCEQIPYSDAELRLLSKREKWNMDEGGYEHLQSTKPQTPAYGLTDSPVGLAAWILEKMQSWSDCDGELERVFSKDQLLSNISIYWFTETIASSMRLYYETRRNSWQLPPGQIVRSPTGISVFPRELSVPPREWADRIYNVQHWTDMPKGGHFAAAEQPDLLANDIGRFVRRFRPLA
jgi:pimeloyl-ACP methyl ester carboxylesterase